jgi:glycosyltransferase involved in cell wall biosynthesis
MLVHCYYPQDIRVRREAEALVEAGFGVHVICLRAPGKSGRFLQPSRESINGVHVCRLPIARRRGTAVRYLFEYMSLIILGAWKLIVIHLKNPFMAVHIHNMPDALILAGLIPKWTGAKLVLDIHDPMLEIYMQTKNRGQRRISKRVLRWQERWSRGLADRIITVNEPMRENIQDKGVPPNRIFVVHNFPDTLYLPVKDDIASWTRHKDNIVWLYAGTITRQYRLDLAVQALALASPHLPPITLRLLGEGNDLERVLRLAEDLGVRHRIECLEPVHIDQLGKFMKGADIGISCQQGGPFGDLQFSSKVIDYLSQGLPVVSSRTTTLARYIPEDTVFYFEPENAEDMAEKVIFLWNHPDVVKRKMENAKKLFPLYTWQKEKTKLIQFYRGVCDSCDLASN